MNRELKGLCLLWGLLGCLVPLTCFGQIGGGVISGYVLDTSKAVVPGVDVSARNVDTGVSTPTVTNDSGYFEFPLLPAGKYVIEAHHAGFGAAQSEPFTLSTGTQPRLDLTLPVASTVSKVEVTGAAPLVDTQKTDVGAVISTDQVSQLPLSGRSWLSLVNLQPGAQNAPSSSAGGRGGMWFNGSPAYGNQMLVDGVDMSFVEVASPPIDQAGGAGTSQMGGISLGAISEVRVDSSSFSAEYGNSIGGTVNLTTKSGTNKFHGDLFEMVQNDAMNAATFFANRGGSLKPILRYNQFGGDVGGPVLKDKLFFFLNYEGLRERTESQETGYVPTALMLSEITNPQLQAVASLFLINYPETATSNPLVADVNYFTPLPDTENDSLARVDYNWGKQRFALRFSNNWSNYVSPTFEPVDSQAAPFHYSNVYFEYTASISATMLNEFRYGWGRVNLDRKDSTLNEGGYLTISSPSTGLGAQSEIHYRDTPDTIVDNFTWIHGAHSLKFGTQFMDRLTWRHQDTGLYTYFTSPQNLIANNPYQILFGIPADKRLDDWTMAFFAQDDWRLSRNLDINLGLRYENYTPMTGMYNLDSSNPYGSFIAALGDPMFAAHHKDFSPRLGVAWDVKGNQKLVVRAGGSISYLPPQAILMYDDAAISPLLPETLTLTPSDVPSGYSIAYPFPKLSFVASAIANPQQIVADGFITGRNVNDFNWKDFEAGNWNLSVQGALTKSTSLQVAYVGNHAFHMYFPNFPNQFMPGATARPYPSYGAVQFTNGAASSSYDALQVSLKQRAFHGLMFDAYYTYANTLSYGNVNSTENINLSNDTFIQDPWNIANTYGPVDGSIRHLFVLDHTYLLPTPGFAQNSSILKQAIGGWSLDGIMTIRSGLPLNVLAGKDLVRDQNVGGDRPNIVPGVSPYIRSTTGTLQWLNPAAFDYNTPYNEMVFGDLAYNAMRGKGAFMYDSGVHKDFHIKERALFTFRVEMFNIFNHPVFTAYDLTDTDPKFGQATSASAGRTLQLVGMIKF